MKKFCISDHITARAQTDLERIRSAYEYDALRKVEPKNSSKSEKDYLQNSVHAVVSR